MSKKKKKAKKTKRIPRPAGQRARPYSTKYTPESKEQSGRYLLDRIPGPLWKKVQAKAKREHVALRPTLLDMLTAWVGDAPPTPADVTPETVDLPGIEAQLEAATEPNLTVESLPSQEETSDETPLDPTTRV